MADWGAKVNYNHLNSLSNLLAELDKAGGEEGTEGQDFNAGRFPPKFGIKAIEGI